MRFLLLCLVVFISCKDSPPEEIVMHVHQATIKARVYQLLAGGGGNAIEVPIQGAAVELYTSEEDRALGINLVMARPTDTAGLATFTKLEEKYYYLRVTHAHFGEQLEEVSTPDGTVSFVDVIY
jgi:hypothetical protein